MVIFDSLTDWNENQILYVIKKKEGKCMNSAAIWTRGQHSPPCKEEV